MTEVATITPVRKSLRVDCTPERAFEVFTAEGGRWWPTNTHSIHKEGVSGVDSPDGQQGPYPLQDHSAVRGDPVRRGVDHRKARGRLTRGQQLNGSLDQ